MTCYLAGIDGLPSDKELKLSSSVAWRKLAMPGSGVFWALRSKSFGSFDLLPDSFGQKDHRLLQNHSPNSRPLYLFSGH